MNVLFAGRGSRPEKVKPVGRLPPNQQSFHSSVDVQLPLCAYDDVLFYPRLPVFLRWTGGVQQAHAPWGGNKNERRPAGQ